MRIGRTLPPAAAPIYLKNIVDGLKGFLKGDQEIKRFESEIEDHFFSKHCWLVSSGKAALTLILQALKDMHPDRDEIVIPAFTCFSVPSAIDQSGLKITLCDLARNTLDFDFEMMRRILRQSEGKILSVVPTHLFGLPAGVKRLKEMVDDPEISIIEDAAQAMGEDHYGKKLGTIGDVGFFSLGRGKALSTIEGGIILTNRDDIAECIDRRFRELKTYSDAESGVLLLYALVLNLLLHPSIFWLPKSLPFLKLGETHFDSDFEMKKMSPFQAGLAKNWSDKLKYFQERRKECTNSWMPGIRSGHLSHFVSEKRDIPSLIRFPAMIRDIAKKNRILAFGDQNGLGIMPTYPSAINKIHELKEQFEGMDFPNSSELAKRLITLPVHPFVSNRDIERILDILNKAGASAFFYRL